MQVKEPKQTKKVIKYSATQLYTEEKETTLYLS